MKTILMLLLLPVMTAAETGFDDMILWRESAKSMQGESSLFPSSLCEQGFGLTYLYANPYNINSLNWDYLAAQYGRGGWGAFSRIKSYRLEGLYFDGNLVTGFGYKTDLDISLSIALDWTREKYRDVYYDRVYRIYDKLDLDFGSSYEKGRWSASAWINHINLHKPYDFPGITKPDLRFTYSLMLEPGILLSAGYSDPGLGLSRWYFGQRAKLLDRVVVKLGLLNNPNVLFWGLDLSWKRITLDFTYFAIGRLNDTSVMGISYGAR